MRLETTRLILRELTAEDAPAVLAYRTDPAYPAAFYEAQHLTPEGVRQFLQMLIDYRQEEPRTKFQLGIVRKDGGSLIGNCGLRERTAQASEADIGIELAPSAWSRGYAQEALEAILRFGFEERRLRRLTAEIVVGNQAALRLVERLGMRLEGPAGPRTVRVAMAAPS